MTDAQADELAALLYKLAINPLTEAEQARVDALTKDRINWSAGR